MKIIEVDLHSTHHLVNDESLYCCSCNKKLDGAAVGSQAPFVGCISLCHSCGHVMVYKGTNTHLKLETITEAELEQIKKQDRDAFLTIIALSTSIKILYEQNKNRMV